MQFTMLQRGKNYYISEVVNIEKYKLIETSWPAHYWNESRYLYNEAELTRLKYVINFKGKGSANLVSPMLAIYNKSEMKKTITNIKNYIEGE